MTGILCSLTKHRKWMNHYSLRKMWVKASEFIKKFMMTQKYSQAMLPKNWLLGSGDNHLADEAEKYLQVTFKSKLVYSAKVHSPLSSFVSLLKCIDNVPGYYSVEDFAREVFEMLVNTPNACAQKLGNHIHGQNYSFIQRSSSWLSQWK